MTQIALPLDWSAEQAAEAFLLGPSNEIAVRRIESFGTWPVSTIILTGPRKSGRSLFGRIFARKSGAVLFDDAERRDETEIFHAWNEAQANRRPLLLIADAPPPRWSIQLPDLRSRLSATPVVGFGNPDEKLIAQLIEHLLERRGIAVAPELTSYLTPRVERTHHAVLALVDRLDAASLSKKRPITLALARDVLAVDARAAVA